MKVFYFFLLGILLVFILNKDSLTAYFSQDDFFHLNQIEDKNLTDIPKFFITKAEDQTFYRPLSREVFNLIMYKFFDLNPLPFHLVNATLFILVAVMLYKITQQLFRQNLLRYLAVLAYFISPIHNTELYYLASVQTLLATLFSLICIFFFLKKSISLSLIFFIMALLSHESAVVTPLILLVLNLFLFKKVNLNIFLFLIPATLILSVTIFGGLPTPEVYRPVFNPKTVLNSLSWYTLWSMGLPEMLVDFTGPGFTINPNFLRWYGDYVLKVFPLCGLIIFLISVSIFRNKDKQLLRNLFSIAILFIISISPFLFFPQKKFVYYLEYTSIWFSIGLALAMIRKRWGAVLLIFLFLISFQTVNLNKITYWAAKRAKAAESLINTVKLTPRNKSYYFINDPQYPFIAEKWGGSSKQAFYILSGSNAIQLLFKDKNIKVYYEDIDGPPDSKTDQIILVAKFPY